jgi:ABC-2 type transport system permease protein
MLSFTLYIVFVQFLKVGGDIRHYASYLLLGIMCWSFFTEITTGGVGAVVGKGDLIRKISIPRYLTVLSTSASACINFFLNLVVLGVIMAINGVEINAGLIIFAPLLLIELYAVALSLAFILSAAFVRFRDISFVWEVFIQMFFYATPILYPVSVITEKFELGKFVLLNPIAQIIQDLRYIFVTPQTQTSWELLGGWAVLAPAIVALLVVSSVVYFKREARSFAENV